MLMIRNFFFLSFLSLIFSFSSVAQNVEKLTGHSYEVHTVSFSNDGALLASGSGDRTAIIWDVANKKEVFRITEHKRTIYAVAFSKLKTNLLATSSSDGHLVLWDVDSRKMVKTLVEGDTTSNGILSLDFSPNKDLLAVSYMGGEVALWDTTTFRLLRVTQAHPYGFAMSVHFSHDGSRLVTTGGIDNSVRVFDTSDLSLVQIFEVVSENKQQIESFKSFASGHIKNFQEDDYRGTIWDAAFSPDGKLIASVDSGGFLTIWRMGDSEPVKSTRVNSYLALCVEYSNDGNNIYVGVDALNSEVGNYVKTIDAHSIEIVSEIDIHKNRIRGMSLSPNGKVLATASWDETVKLMSLEN